MQFSPVWIFRVAFDPAISVHPMLTFATFVSRVLLTLKLQLFLAFWKKYLTNMDIKVSIYFHSMDSKFMDLALEEATKVQYVAYFVDKMLVFL